MEFRLQVATKHKIERKKKKQTPRERETNTFKTNVFQQIYVKNDLFGQNNLSMSRNSYVSLYLCVCLYLSLALAHFVCFFFLISSVLCAEVNRNECQAKIFRVIYKLSYYCGRLSVQGVLRVELTQSHLCVCVYLLKRSSHIKHERHRLFANSRCASQCSMLAISQNEVEKKKKNPINQTIFL